LILNCSGLFLCRISPNSTDFPQKTAPSKTQKNPESLDFQSSPDLSVNSGKTVRLIRTNGALSPFETVRFFFLWSLVSGRKGCASRGIGGRGESPSP
jgi:hypothetical protein